VTCELVAELATSFGGDVALAARMIRESAAAGAHTVKVQSYSREAINPADPQAEWLRQAWLSPEAHRELMTVAEACGVQFLATPFDVASLVMLRGLGQRRFKVASSQSEQRWPWQESESVVASYPWGLGAPRGPVPLYLPITAIPLYPTPLEAVGRATVLDGWSDHTVGLTACQRALVLGVRYLEVHVTIDGARQMPFDKTMQDIRVLREMIDDLETINSGVSQQFRERWR
jgi:sialic acid synthase SpsE